MERGTGRGRPTERAEHRTGRLEQEHSCGERGVFMRLRALGPGASAVSVPVSERVSSRSPPGRPPGAAHSKHQHFLHGGIDPGGEDAVERSSPRFERTPESRRAVQGEQWLRPAGRRKRYAGSPSSRRVQLPRLVPVPAHGRFHRNRGPRIRLLSVSAFCATGLGAAGPLSLPPDGFRCHQTGAGGRAESASPDRRGILKRRAVARPRAAAPGRPTRHPSRRVAWRASAGCVRTSGPAGPRTRRWQG